MNVERAVEQASVEYDAQSGGSRQTAPIPCGDQNASGGILLALEPERIQMQHGQKVLSNKTGNGM